jgi:hypothetical protein
MSQQDRCCESRGQGRITTGGGDSLASMTDAVNLVDRAV